MCTSSFLVNSYDHLYAMNDSDHQGRVLDNTYLCMKLSYHKFHSFWSGYLVLVCRSDMETYCTCSRPLLMLMCALATGWTLQDESYSMKATGWKLQYESYMMKATGWKLHDESYTMKEKYLLLFIVAIDGTSFLYQ